MYFTTGDLLLALAILFFIYASPAIYIAPVLYGMIKAGNDRPQLKIIALVNVVTIINIIFYLFTLPLNFHDEKINFFALSLFIFSPAGWSLFFKMQSNTSRTTYLTLFICSLLIYNIYYYPQKIAQDNTTRMGTLLQQGDISKLKTTFRSGCPDNQSNLFWLHMMFSNEVYPESAFLYLIDCANVTSEAGKHTDALNEYYLKALRSQNTNSKLLNLAMHRFYAELNQYDKDRIASSLLMDINTTDNAKSRQLSAERINAIIASHPDFKAFIKVDDKHIENLIKNGRQFSINYLRSFHTTKKSNYLLAIDVLNNNPELINKIKNNRNILNTYLFSEQGGIWETRDVELRSYIFYYGSKALIRYLLDNNLDNTHTFDHQKSIYNHSSHQDETVCANYLTKYIDFNPQLTESEKESLEAEIRNRSECPAR
ncbi:hypothetical protein RPN21_25135 [Klebsiella aerogenes]|uniref:hypothetical protein n=1 Tax=Klebsiella aerogenes TaxID=548 RepID=UPI0028A35BAE|nr:hypothetical protein [Klebsiella aerogenes]MDT4311715.1 hypothetical protein [Klebsiella aerogenes]